MSNYSRRRHRPWYRRIKRDHVLLAVLLLFVLIAVVFILQALRASSSLRLAANQANILQSQIVAGDDGGAKIALKSLQDSADKAKSATDGPLWSIGSKVPFVGKNVEAVQKVSEVTDQIAQDALPPVVNFSSQLNLDTFSPKDGTIDLAAISQIEPTIVRVTRALAVADKELDSIDAESLLVPLRGPVGNIQLKVSGAHTAAASSELAARLMPDMMGVNGTRRYLLLIQNNAEIRSTGGISGSYAILKAKQGKLSMGFQGSIQDLLPLSSSPVIPMTKAEKILYAPTLVTDIRDVNITPDFPRSGQIAKALIKKRLNEDVDGVISVDPVALSYVLAGTGPVSNKEGFALDQFSAVDTLLNRTYLLVKDPAQQDDVFKVAARLIFNAVTAGGANSRLTIDGLVRAANDNRLLVWSARPAEQKLIAPSGVSGKLSRNAGATPHVGLYLGDAASTKMEYYLDYYTNVSANKCLSDGVQQLSTSTVLKSNAPDGLPKSVTGTGDFTPRGTMRLVLRFYSPYGGGFTDVRVDGKPQTVYADSQFGRNVTRLVLTLKPGQSYTVTTSMLTGKGQDKAGVFSTTPGVRTTGNDVAFKSACS